MSLVLRTWERFYPFDVRHFEMDFQIVICLQNGTFICLHGENIIDIGKYAKLKLNSIE